jgi:hypothetical protein
MYKEGTQAQGFRDVGFCMAITLITGILEEWNIGTMGKSFFLNPILQCFTIPMFLVFHYSAIPLFQ